jgi:hypothetical protein
MIPAFTILAFQNQPYVTEELQRVLQRISLSTILLMTLVFPFVFLVLGGVGRLVDNLNRAVAAKIANVTPWLGKFVLACYLLFLFVPLIFKTQPIGNIETITPKPDSLKYAIQVVSKFVLNSSLLRDDFLLIRSFWGGFGCPETVFPRLPVQLLQNVVWLGWFLGLYSMIKERTLQPVLAYLALAALVLIWLTLVAFGVQTVTVHGRYLVGFYMLFISGGIVGFWKAFQSPPLFSLVASRLTPVAFPLFLALILGLHAATFTALFFRYFGV